MNFKNDRQVKDDLKGLEKQYCFSVKLEGHPSANCEVVIYENGRLDLYSYNTLVVQYSATRNGLYCTGLYSATTRKHISWFLKEYFPKVSYYDIKPYANTLKPLLLNEEGGIK